ncbi:hypothetical protein SUGI_0651990 [Cryptomeria japonica]|nr:hypothetical protein SUGI_0651990 [Cryptomeria japonica]
MAKEEGKFDDLAKEKAAAQAWYNLHNSRSKSEGKIWDCDSALYDSFELRSFSFQLNRALSVVSRSSPRSASVQTEPSGCFRSFSLRRNRELNYEKQSDEQILIPKSRKASSWSLKKAIAGFHWKKYRVQKSLV